LGTLNKAYPLRRLTLNNLVEMGPDILGRYLW
jgi:hypothetical protein